MRRFFILFITILAKLIVCAICVLIILFGIGLIVTAVPISYRPFVLGAFVLTVLAIIMASIEYTITK